MFRGYARNGGLKQRGKTEVKLAEARIDGTAFATRTFAGLVARDAVWPAGMGLLQPATRQCQAPPWAPVCPLATVLFPGRVSPCVTFTSAR